MKLSLKLRDDVLALLKIVQDIQMKKEDAWSDSKASQLCFGHGEFVHKLRQWDGGAGGPTLEKTAKFEQFLRDQIGERAYEEFLKSRRRLAAAA